jgi:hypothetical protein
MADPPFDDGALHETLTELFPGNAMRLNGALGVDAGVPGSEEDAVPTPVVFFARMET